MKIVSGICAVIWGALIVCVMTSWVRCYMAIKRNRATGVIPFKTRSYRDYFGCALFRGEYDYVEEIRTCRRDVQKWMALAGGFFLALISGSLFFIALSWKGIL